jgi:hypothetical protein
VLDPQLLVTLLTSLVCYGDGFTFLLITKMVLPGLIFFFTSCLLNGVPSIETVGLDDKMVDECGAVGGMRIGKGNQRIGEYLPGAM